MKTELITKLKTNRDELLNLLADLSDEQLTTIPVVGSAAAASSTDVSHSSENSLDVAASWTIKDSIGQISYWEQVIHDHVRESFSEGRPRPMRDDENDNIVNPREAAKRKDWSWQRVRAEFENTRRALIERVESLREEQLAFVVPNPWWGETGFYSVGAMIESDAIGHAREHIEQIKKWKREVGG
jgi:hypothetical protein